jgi:predicted Zn-dependent protease
VLDKLRSGCRPLVVAGALLLAACGGAENPAPVAERSSAGPYAGTRANAGTEVGEGDWTAKVRPLGDSASPPTRALSGNEGGEPAATRNGGARTVATGSSASRKVNPAVVSLVNTANAQYRAGDYARAAATLERAIAIEPDNPWLWHRLAATRLAEGRLEQAAGLAAKSNSLPAADRSLQVDNWKLIAEVRRRQGDAPGAAAAEAQARKLAN